jgi:hypothetical protein
MLRIKRGTLNDLTSEAGSQVDPIRLLGRDRPDVRKAIRAEYDKAKLRNSALALEEYLCDYDAIRQSILADLKNAKKKSTPVKKRKAIEAEPIEGSDVDPNDNRACYLLAKCPRDDPTGEQLRFLYACCDYHGLMAAMLPYVVWRATQIAIWCNRTKCWDRRNELVGEGVLWLQDNIVEFVATPDMGHKIRSELECGTNRAMIECFFYVMRSACSIKWDNYRRANITPLTDLG